jgi:hypothetical protein
VLITGLYFLISPRRLVDVYTVKNIKNSKIKFSVHWIWPYLFFSFLNVLKIVLPVPLWAACFVTMLVSPFLFFIYVKYTKQCSLPAALFYFFSFCGDMAANFEQYGFISLAILVVGYMLAHICIAWINFHFIKKIDLSIYLLSSGVILIYAAGIIPALHLDSSNYIASTVVLIYIFCLLSAYISSTQIHLNEKMFYYPVGAKLYIMSDTLIALTHFPLLADVKVLPNVTLVKVIIWVTYSLAICFFTLGLIKLSLNYEPVAKLD